jgi:hypothetical protein
VQEVLDAHESHQSLDENGAVSLRGAVLAYDNRRGEDVVLAQCLEYLPVVASV